MNDRRKRKSNGGKQKWLKEKKEHDYDVFQKFVEDMIRTQTLVTNTGVFVVDGKDYILIAEIKEVGA